MTGLAGLPRPPDWMGDAVCAQTDPEAFFPEKGGSTREAKRTCGGCPVTAECLEYALAGGIQFGIWGGLSERERRRLAPREPGRPGGSVKPISHGTHGGYQTHIRRREAACGSCREAHRAYQRRRAAERGAA